MEFNESFQLLVLAVIESKVYWLKWEEADWIVLNGHLEAKRKFWAGI